MDREGVGDGVGETHSDPLSETLGISFDRIEAGLATTSLTVGDEHLNANGKLHGAMIFALADAAAGAVGQGDDETVVGIETNTSFLGAVDRGEHVVATAEVTHESSRFNETQVSIEKEDGTAVATYRVRGYRIEE